MKLPRSEADLRTTQCETKAAYRSAKEAIRVARNASAAREKRLRVYACPHCGRFHLTSVLDPMHGIREPS